MKRTRRRQGGFTLIEILVAFTIMATLLVGFLAGTRRALDGIAATEAHGRLLAHAENRLAMIGTVLPLVEGRESGRGEDHVWEVAIGRYPLPPDRAGMAGEVGLVLYEIEVRVGDENGREERLMTLRAGSPGP